MPTFVRGFKKTLNEEDLFEILNEQKSSYLGDMLEEAWEKEKTKSDPSLWKALWKVFGLNFLSLGLLATCVELIFKYVEYFCCDTFVFTTYFQNSPKLIFYKITTILFNRRRKCK